MLTSCAGSAGCPAVMVLVISVSSPSQQGSIVRAMTGVPPSRPEHLDLRGQGLTAVPDWVWSLAEFPNGLGEHHARVARGPRTARLRGAALVRRAQACCAEIHVFGGPLSLYVRGHLTEA